MGEVNRALSSLSNVPRIILAFIVIVFLDVWLLGFALAPAIRITIAAASVVLIASLLLFGADKRAAARLYLGLVAMSLLLFPIGGIVFAAHYGVLAGVLFFALTGLAALIALKGLRFSSPFIMHSEIWLKRPLPDVFAAMEPRIGAPYWKPHVSRVEQVGDDATVRRFFYDFPGAGGGEHAQFRLLEREENSHFVTLSEPTGEYGDTSLGSSELNRFDFEEMAGGVRVSCQTRLLNATLYMWLLTALMRPHQDQLIQFKATLLGEKDVSLAGNLLSLDKAPKAVKPD